MPSGNGLKDAIWKLLVGGWAYRCHLEVAGRRMGLKMPSGNGLKDAIWRVDGKLLEMGLQMPSRNDC